MRDRRHWLTRERIVLYGTLMLVFFLAAAIMNVKTSRDGLVAGTHRPLGSDFIAFWGVSHLALSGHAASAYDFDMRALTHAEQVAVPASDVSYPWNYPPAFVLLILPLALMPYFVAFWVFMATTLAMYVLAFWRAVGQGLGLWCLAIFPAAWINFGGGQNGFLTAALAGGALLCLPRRPVMSGVLIGLLSIKPHLAVLFPLALVAAGAWRTIAVAAATGLAVNALGTAVLGTDVLWAFWRGLGHAQGMLAAGERFYWTKIPSVFVMVRSLGGAASLAYAVHAAAAAVAAWVVWRVWRASGDWMLRGAALMTATFFISPYDYNYDLVWLAFPIAWLALVAQREGWRALDREILLAVALWPLLWFFPDWAFKVQLSPIPLAGLLWVIRRRVS